VFREFQRKCELHLVLLRSLLLLVLLLHGGHGRDPSMSVADGRWSTERYGFDPWARPLTVNDNGTSVCNAQLKNGKSTDISVA
jgi:hypothetical protein